MAAINFFSHDVIFNLPKPKKTSSWIKRAIKNEGSVVGQLNFIFCSDSYLLTLNLQYLNHQTYTDIITFDTSEDNEALEGDIFISIDRVRENAEKFNKTFMEELHRVIIHGVLHLLGYSDKSERKKREMRKKEDAYLSLRSN
jgi:probable rRNA maturation factor